MSEKSPLNDDNLSVSSPAPTPSPQPPIPGRLRISLRGKAVTPTGTAAPAQSSPRNAISETPIETAPSAPQSAQPTPPTIVINDPVPQQPKPVEDKDRDIQWRAESLLQQILAPKAPAFEFVPPLASPQGIASVKVRGSEEMADQGPMTQQEALLMVSALKVLGKADYAKLLLPSSLSSSSTTTREGHNSSEHPSSLYSNPQNDVEHMDISHDAPFVSTSLTAPSNQFGASSIDTSQHISSLSSPIPLSAEELNIIYASAQSAQQGARAASRKWEEDDESLALELELEFTQLDPITRVELLKQLDAAEQEQFTASGARSERLNRAAKEAAFHNAQMTVDRSRLGPYYYDPHTRSQQSYHAIAIHEPEIEATILDESNPKITVINPELPLPRSFEYFPIQPGDLNVALRKSLVTGSEDAVGATYNANKQSLPSATSLDSAMQVIQKVKRNTIRYAVMDGYAQWLKAEISNHKMASAPLDPYTSWTQQFHAQWDVLQPQGCFDFVLSEHGAVGAQKSTTLLSSMSTSSNGINADQKASAKVSTSVRNVWKAHRKHLEAEHAVVLAMEGAERARRRAKFGDPEDKSIDPGKPLTRDERRKLQKREKEHQKMKLFFLREKKRVFGENYSQVAQKFLFSVTDSLTASTSSILNPLAQATSANQPSTASNNNLKASTNSVESTNHLHLLLHQLSWYDLSTLYLSLGFSMAQLQDDDHPKVESEKPRSHKKGAAKAAKLAAKKLEAASATAPATTNPKSNVPSSPSSPSSSKKRSRVVHVLEDDSAEEEAFKSSSASKSSLYSRPAPSPMSLYPMSPYVSSSSLPPTTAAATASSSVSSPQPLPAAAPSSPYAAVAPSHLPPSRGLAQCAGCGAMDEATELVRCTRCRTPYHTYCIDDQDINFQSWSCPRCSN